MMPLECGHQNPGLKKLCEMNKLVSSIYCEKEKKNRVETHKLKRQEIYPAIPMCRTCLDPDSNNH